MAERAAHPTAAAAKIEEAVAILKAIGMPKEQCNERSALTLLALADLAPNAPWKKATSPLRGVTELMDFMSSAYGKEYKPNTRETVRRFTLHQFVQAGIVLINPDDPARPTNSPKTVYCLAPPFLALLKKHGMAKWKHLVKTFVAQLPALSMIYAAERALPRIKVQLKPGLSLELSPGGQNPLIKQILEQFCEYFAPASHLIYVGDTQRKWGYFDKTLLDSLGVKVATHGKMPDVVVYRKDKNWLLLIEAVTSHGPVTPKRQAELKILFKDSTAGLVFVSTFLSKASFIKYMVEIAWETEVWVAEHPTHIIHFNGERFLGPYGD